MWNEIFFRVYSQLLIKIEQIVGDGKHRKNMSKIFLHYISLIRQRRLSAINGARRAICVVKNRARFVNFALLILYVQLTGLISPPHSLLGAYYSRERCVHLIGATARSETTSFLRVYYHHRAFFARASSAVFHVFFFFRLPRICSLRFYSRSVRSEKSGSKDA